MSAAATATPAEKPKPTIDVKLIVPFVNSVRSVFATMVKVGTEVERPRLKMQPAPSYDVSSIIGFSGQIVGSVVVSFQREAAEALASAFACTPLTLTDADFPDAIGELANMIAGGAKTQLGSLANITVPNVVIGSGHVIARLSGVPCIEIPCKTPVGNFAVEVNIKQLAAPAAAQ
jgi:chemotaxis protein CheX